MLRLVSAFSLFICSFIMSVSTASAQELKPFQQKALDAMLADFDAETRPMAEAQFKPMLAAMNEAQVQLMLASYASGGQEPEQDEVEKPASDYVATAEDLEFNRAQYEPAIRNLWQLQKAFDDLVDSTVEQSCGSPGEFAVFGSGWRYQVYPLNPTWTRASNSPDLDVQIIGGSYAQSDARYQYDFSAVSTRYDEQAVIAAVTAACNEYRRIGQEFLSAARGRMTANDLPGGYEMENAANARLGPVREQLNEQLERLSPGGNGALVMALLNGVPVR